MTAVPPPVPDMEFLDEDAFDARFKPLNGPDGSMFWEHKDTLTYAIEQVWSITEVDGELYAIPGYHVVNVIGYTVTEVPWPHESFEVEYEKLGDPDE